MKKRKSIKIKLKKIKIGEKNKFLERRNAFYRQPVGSWPKGRIAPVVKIIDQTFLNKFLHFRTFS